MPATLSRPGVVDNTTDGSWSQDNALFLKVFAGEVLTAFEETNVFKNLHFERTIQHGKSASFPATWKADAHYHTPGNAVLGSNEMAHNERLIHIDDLLISDTFIYDLDELKNHYDVRGIYSEEAGRALARTYDKNVAKVGVLTARASGDVGDHSGGSVITNASAKTDGEVLAGMIFDSAQALDEKDVPEQDRYCAVKPAQYYLLAQTTKVMNKDWDGKGSYSDGKIYRIADVELVKTNNLPTTNIASATAGENNTYYGDFSVTAGLVWQKSAMGTVKLKDLATQMTSNDFAVMYQGTLIVAKYAIGHGTLRPECAVELATA